MYKSNLFKDYVVLVTGGRSGIGFDIAKKFLSLGAIVFIASRNEKLLIKASKDLESFGKIYHKVCDIRNTNDISELSKMISKKTGKLDILVNNAGGQFPAPANLISENGWAAVINNNLNGTFYMCQNMAKTFFIPQNKGNIVNITANIIRGFPGMSHTGAARAGVENLTKSLGQEWAENNIRVNAVAPGTIASSGLENYPEMMKNFIKESEKKNLMGRFGSVEDVSNAVMFLASPLSSYISGITIPVDGLEHLSGDRMELYKTILSFIKK
ncbi:MAG: SDR family oxidoreductase [Flavobacteriaceae bacterium]|nr:SDR family oxidoreductase [Flavobacteriaceae bacterium]